MEINPILWKKPTMIEPWLIIDIVPTYVTAVK